MNPNLSSTALLLPPLSPLTAHILSLAFTTSYVGSLYISQHLSAFARRRDSSRSSRRRTSPPRNGNGNGNGNGANGTGTANAPSTDIDSSEATAEGDGGRDGQKTVPPISGPDTDSTMPRPYSRDHPTTIKRRMTAVIISTTLSLSGVYYTIRTLGSSSYSRSYTSLQAIAPTLRLLGLSLPTPSSSSTGLGVGAAGRVLPYVLAPSLLLGPLVAMYLDGEVPVVGARARGEGLVQRLKRGWGEFGLTDWRNYVVAPITEELVFRSTILAVSILGGLSVRSLVFGTPLWFGIAHAHHALEVYRKGGSTSTAAVQAVLGCLFQLSYTTLFGWFASYLFIRTGSVLPPLTAHVYCNIMGIYLPSTAVARHPRRRGLIWGSYLIGIAGFIWGCKRL